MSTSVRRQYVWDSQGNKILVGDIRECWEKIERIKLEKKVEEERADYQRIRSNCLGSGGGGGQLRPPVPRPASPPGPRFREVSIRGPEVTVQRQRAGDGGGAGGAQNEADPEK